MKNYNLTFSSQDSKFFVANTDEIVEPEPTQAPDPSLKVGSASNLKEVVPTSNPQYYKNGFVIALSWKEMFKTLINCPNLFTFLHAFGLTDLFLTLIYNSIHPATEIIFETWADIILYNFLNLRFLFSLSSY